MRDFIASILMGQFAIYYNKEISFLDSLLPLNPVFVAKSAKIHESYLKEWTNIEKLDPARVKIVNPFVELQGPVWIVFSTSYLTTSKITSAGLVALIGGLVALGLAHIVVSKAFPLNEQKKEKYSIHPVSIAVGLITGAALGALTWIQLSKVVPKTAGIFFRN